MSKITAISFAGLAPVKQGVAVILAERGLTLSPAGKALDKASGGAMPRAAKQRKLKGAKKRYPDRLVPETPRTTLLVVDGGGPCEGGGGG